jgi:hypothetical protein
MVWAQPSSAGVCATIWQASVLPFLAAVIAALRLSSLPDLIRQSMLSGSSAWTTGSQTSEAAPFERLSPVVTRTQDRHPSISARSL